MGHPSLSRCFRTQRRQGTSTSNQILLQSPVPHARTTSYSNSSEEPAGLHPSTTAQKAACERRGTASSLRPLPSNLPSTPRRRRTKQQPSAAVNNPPRSPSAATSTR